MNTSNEAKNIKKNTHHHFNLLIRLKISQHGCGCEMLEAGR